ncbi:MAG: TolB family protein [Gaiellaceae bacterium]
MRGDYPIPPSRDLPPDRLAQRREHLLSEITQRSSRRPHSRRVVLVLAAGALVLVVGTASAFGTVRDLLLGPPVNSQIAFESVREGRSAIYVMDANGSGQRRMAAQGLPIWSPDGRKIVFERRRGLPPNSDLYVMNTDGSGLRRLTRDPAYDERPVWSPDGRKIAFDRNNGNEPDVYVINVDGSGERNLTGDDSSSSPTWSPDGRKIAFASARDGSGPGIYVMNADGSGQRRLTRNSGAFAPGDGTPRWSPDRRRIAFVRVGRVGKEPAARYVYVMNADGSKPRRLARMANAFGVDYGLPSWSPNSKKIVFVSERDGNPEIYVVNADGSGKRNLTRHQGYDGDPAWSPDGRKIVFVSERDGNFEVYVMNADGSGQQNLTRNPANDRSPVWSPRRKGS